MTDSNRSTEAVNISRDPYGLSKLRRAFEESQHRTGMVVGLPKVTIDASHVNHALVYIDALREEIQHLRSSAGARVEQFDPLENFAQWCLGASPEAEGMVEHIIRNARGALDHAAEIKGRAPEPRGGQPPQFYRLQDVYDRFHFVDYDARMWELIVVPQPLTKEVKP